MPHPSAARIHDPDRVRADAQEPPCPDAIWDAVADCRRCAIRGQALFSPLRGSDLGRSLDPIRSATLPAGSILYAEGGTAQAIYTVRRGLVKLVKQTPEGTKRIVRLLGPGAAVGLEGLRQGVYWHDAITMGQTGLCCLPFQVIDQLQLQNAQLVDRLLTQWEKYVEYADRWITELSTGVVRSRVNRLMWLLVELTDSDTGEIELPCIEDLADILGASVESVSRAMADLKRGKVLIRTAPRTYRCDLDSLFS